MVSFPSSKTRTYRFPVLTRILLIFGTVLFSIFAYWSALDRETFTAYYCFTPFALFCLTCFILCSYTIQIDDDGISAISFFIKRNIAWHEIVDVQFNESGFILLNNGGDKKVAINSQVAGFMEVVGFIAKRISPIWKSKTLHEFHTSLSTLAVFVGIGLFGGLMIYVGAQEIVSENVDLLIDISVILIGLLCLGISIIVSIKSKFEEDYLVITHLIWKKRIHVSEVEGFYLDAKMIENAYHYPFHVKLKNGKALVFNGLREGTFVFANSFQYWYEKHQHLLKN